VCQPTEEGERRGEKGEGRGEPTYRIDEGVPLLNDVVVSRVDTVDTPLKYFNIEFLPWC
jgi:hypothetical protein